MIVYMIDDSYNTYTHMFIASYITQLSYMIVYMIDDSYNTHTYMFIDSYIT